MIIPTIGRIVEFMDHGSDQPNAAIIVHVHDDRLVNLTVFGHHGDARACLNTPLKQPEDESPKDESRYCRWMPYQITKGYGSESGEKEAGTQNIGGSPATDAADPGPQGVGEAPPPEPPTAEDPADADTGAAVPA